MTSCAHPLRPERLQSSANRQHFDATATRYAQEATRNGCHRQRLFSDHFLRRIVVPTSGPLIEIGPGAGLFLEAATRAGLECLAVEPSHAMARVACERLGALGNRVSWLYADVRRALARHDLRGAHLVAHAVLHLFPKCEVTQILQRLVDALQPGGLAWLSTTAEDRSQEGLFHESNPNRPAHGLKADVSYRAFYTRAEFDRMVEGSGLQILDRIEDDCLEGMHPRRWYTLIAQNQLR